MTNFLFTQYVNTGMPYLNMYCYLCNTSPYRPVFDFGKPWDIKVYCKKYTEHRNFIMLTQIVNAITETNCYDTYLPNSKGTDQQTIPLCNMGKTRYDGICNWFVKDPDIQYACENVSSGALNLYSPEFDDCKYFCKNSYCAVCNPEVM